MYCHYAMTYLSGRNFGSIYLKGYFNMNFSFIDTDLINIQDNLELQITEIPNTNHKVIVIDNFLKNPEDLREIASKQLFEKTPNNKNSHPGWVSLSNLKFNQITKTAEYLADVYYNVINRSIVYQFNLFQGGMPCKYTSLLPHVDSSFFAFQIYLNLPTESQGGTNFYKHIDSGLDHNVEYFDSDFKMTEDYWKFMNHYKEVEENNYNTILDSRQIDPQYWQPIHHVEMKYNRFVLYPSYVFHTAYIEKEWYQEEKRVGLVGFMK